MRWLALAFILLATPAAAEEKLDCKSPVTQADMTQCAAEDFDKADKALNALWPKIKADAEASDKDAGGKEYVEALMASQRAWLAFRDAECNWQSFTAHGGSLENMIYVECQEKLTRQRIKQLQTGPSE